MSLQSTARRLLTEAAAGAAVANIGTPLGAALADWLAALRGAADGLASLDAGGRLPSGQLPEGYLDERYLNFAERGAAGGVAALGDDGIVPNDQLPAYVSGGARGVLGYATTAALTVTLSPGRVYRVGGRAHFSTSVSGSTDGTTIQASTTVNVTGAATSSLATLNTSYGNASVGTGGTYQDTIVVDELFQVGTARAYTVALSSGQQRVFVEDVGALTTPLNGVTLVS